MTQFYDNVFVMIDGKPIGPGGEQVTLTRESRGEYGVDMSPFYAERMEGMQKAKPVTIECSVPISGPEDFAALFHREPPGASMQTLAKRAKYGGRKGRRAMRRMLDRALPTDIQFGPHWWQRMRGKIVMIGEEIVIKAHVPRRGRR